jgi:hypothetical protein
VLNGIHHHGEVKVPRLYRRGRRPGGGCSLDVVIATTGEEPEVDVVGNSGKRGSRESDDVRWEPVSESNGVRWEGGSGAAGAVVSGGCGGGSDACATSERVWFVSVAGSLGAATGGGIQEEKIVD